MNKAGEAQALKITASCFFYSERKGRVALDPVGYELGRGL